MRAEELMIGDWVEVTQTECVADGGHYITWSEYGKVIGITDSYIEVEVRDGEYNVDAHEDELKPIPLTPEILEANGLKIDKYKGGFFPACFKEDEYYDVEIEMKDEEIAWSINCGEYWIKRLNYVHELQHALRLFGINKDIEL